MSSTDDGFKEMFCEELDTFGVKLKAVEAQIGTDPSEDPSSNVWGGICELRGNVEEQDALIAQIVDDMDASANDIGDLKEEGTEARKEINELKKVQDELTELTGFLSNEQEVLIDQVREIRAKAESVGGLGARTQPPPPQE
jgi:DNA repair exonuclease SbcCD ATPase subunit